MTSGWSEGKSERMRAPKDRYIYIERERIERPTQKMQDFLAKSLIPRRAANNTHGKSVCHAQYGADIGSRVVSEVVASQKHHGSHSLWVCKVPKWHRAQKLWQRSPTSSGRDRQETASAKPQIRCHHRQVLQPEAPQAEQGDFEADGGERPAWRACRAG